MNENQKAVPRKQTNVFALRHKLLNKCKTHFLLIMKKKLTRYPAWN